ncbi:hypothetical protein ACFE04_002973 [Oxalis oulophora]
MNKKTLAILMRARMRPNDDTSINKLALSPLTKELDNNNSNKMINYDLPKQAGDNSEVALGSTIIGSQREFENVRSSMDSAISMNKTEVLDVVLDDFAEGYLSLSRDNRRELLLALAKEYDLNRTQVHDLIKQYLGLQLPQARSEGSQLMETEEEGMLSAFYRLERNLRHALKPMYDVLFERLNTHPGGLKVLTSLRADTLKIVANLIDLKRRLGVGRRCFGYLHPAIPGEPLIFIEVALLTTVAQSIQEVLWVDPPVPESRAICALFYSISSTQARISPGLAGINLGKFLIKRVITLVKRDMPHISTFATLSPIPGFMKWLVSKVQSQIKLAEAQGGSDPSGDKFGLTFQENILEPEEEIALMASSEGLAGGKNGMKILLDVLTSPNHEWANSEKLLSALKPILMRLCARYLLQEKKRGKALDSVANFHLQNGAMIERINWMADRSDKGLQQSGGIMVNYVYRMETIEEYAQSYFTTGHIHASQDMLRNIQLMKGHETTTK